MSRFELWKDWYKHSLNHPFYKFLVLIGVAYSPTFEMHRWTKEKFDQHPDWTYHMLDEKPEKSEETKKESDINWGWYIVYLLMVMLNSIMCSIHGFTIVTWQYWVYFWMLVLTFVAGASYRKDK